MGAHDPDPGGGDHEVLGDAVAVVAEGVEHDVDEDYDGEQAMEPKYLGSEAKGFEQSPKLASNLKNKTGNGMRNFVKTKKNR